MNTKENSPDRLGDQGNFLHGIKEEGTFLSEKL